MTTIELNKDDYGNDNLSSEESFPEHVSQIPSVVMADEALVAVDIRTLPPQQKEVTSVEAAEIAAYAGISFAELLKRYDGQLNVHLKKKGPDGLPEYVDVTTDPKRTLLLCLLAFLNVNEGATLDFFAKLQTDNAKGNEAPIFPEQELVEALSVVLKPYVLRIRGNGTINFRADKYFDILGSAYRPRGGSDRKKNLSHKEV